MNAAGRLAVIQKAAKVTAEVLYDLHQGRGDTSTMEVDGQITLRPYLPMIVQTVGNETSRHTEITGEGKEGTIALTWLEEKNLQRHTNAELRELVNVTIRANFEKEKEL